MRELISEASKTVEDSQTAQALHGLLSLKSPECSDSDNLVSSLTKQPNKLVRFQSKRVIVTKDHRKNIDPKKSGQVAASEDSSFTGLSYKAIKPKSLPTQSSTSKIPASDNTMKIILSNSQENQPTSNLMPDNIISVPSTSQSNVLPVQLLSTSIGMVAIPTSFTMNLAKNNDENFSNVSLISRTFNTKLNSEKRSCNPVTSSNQLIFNLNVGELLSSDCPTEAKISLDSLESNSINFSYKMTSNLSTSSEISEELNALSSNLYDEDKVYSEIQQAFSKYIFTIRSVEYKKFCPVSTTPWSKMIEQLNDFVVNLTTFAESIPCFKKLTALDRMNIIQKSSIETDTLFLHYGYPLTQTELSLDLPSASSFIDQLFQFSARFNNLHLTEIETGLFCSVVLCMPGHFFVTFVL
ncbi:hypothetical protein HELRODRAFT_181120 [Helobdella robusta]|uniref:NR LBD domain-containing protein n=1 Tax=Helobdella robusta TaxID=6412 RepID=T1FGM8_HELRO|nr:hypothetical protein HELRODRAFT_181120 [Helobdella robusta]ESN93199.1 hypothetical protein HELRODRAFT_181120 [Helobdella robusta]